MDSTSLSVERSDFRLEIEPADGFRVCHIILNTAAFGSLQAKRQHVYVQYPKDLIFNIEPPELPETKPTVWTALWPTVDQTCESGLSHRELEIVKSLRNGYESEGFYRLQWLRPFPSHVLPSRWIHPWHHRLLTHAESDIEGFDQTDKWLAEQVQLCLNQEWDSDYATAYCRKQGRWIGRETSGIYKRFDLSEYWTGGVTKSDFHLYPTEVHKPRFR